MEAKIGAKVKVRETGTALPHPHPHLPRQIAA